MKEETEFENKKRAFKATIELLSKATNAANFEELVDAFATQFAQECSLAQMPVNQAVLSISKDIKSLNERVHFLDNKIVTEAEGFYKSLPLKEKKLKKRLIEARQKMQLHIKNDNIKEACKYIVVQAEMLSQHLVTLFDIISWVRKQNVVAIAISSKKSGDYLKTWDLLKAVNIRFQCQWNQLFIEEVKSIRDFESHGYHDDDADQMEILVLKIKADWVGYFEEWNRFINLLIDAFYSHT